MVVAADHVRNAHVAIVHHDAEVVRGRAVRARDDEVVELRVLERDRPVDQVIDHHRALERIAEAHHRRHARARLPAIAAAAGIARLLLARELLLAQRIELLLGAVAVIRMSRGQHVADHGAIAVEALRLVVRALVGGESEPRHALEDHPHRLLGGALAIGILDAQHEPAAGPARVEPAVKRRADAPHVEHAGGARGKSGDYGHGTGTAR